MKKLLCVLLATMLVISCFAGCSKKSTDDISSTVSVSDNSVQKEFVKPENYVSVVFVTINPQFKLYLDAKNIVLAIEPINTDAKSIENKITFENQKVEEVVNNLIVAANDSGFIKTDATIDIKITEITDKTVNTTEILNKITASSNDKLNELSIKATVKTAVEVEIEEVNSSKVNTTSNNSQSSNVSQSTTSSTSTTSKTESNTTNTNPVCQHNKTSAVAASTGKNIIDSSKLDVVNHNKVCNDCKAIVATENHTVKDNKCTACGQSNFESLQKSLRTAGIAGGKNGHMGVKVNSDGTPDFDYMMQEGYFAIGYDALQKYLNKSDNNWMYEIPETVYLEALKTIFVISDNLFANLKAQGKYEFFWCNHSYSNGYFYIPYMAAGDVSAFTHKAIGYKDNKNGSLTVYYDYQEGGPDVDVNDRVHQYYYAVEYSYSGASNLTVIKTDEDNYTINGWKPVVESMRIKSIKKVTDISGLTEIK